MLKFVKFKGINKVNSNNYYTSKEDNISSIIFNYLVKNKHHQY